MKTSSSILENFHAEVVVTIPPDEVDSFYKKNLAEASEGIDIPGFRKGKAPKAMMEKHINEEKLWEVTLNDIVEDTLPKALEENKLKALRTIQVTKDKHQPGEEFTYRAKVELMPEIPEYKYRDIPVKIHRQQISEKLIDMSIENLAIRIAQSTPIKDRPAQQGDWTAIALEGYQFTRIKVPGQSDEPKPLFNTQLSVEIGGKRGIKWLDDEIIGLKVGESKTCYPTMPRDFINPPLEQDTEIEAKIRLLWLEEKVIPELTDEFLANNGIAKDMLELRGHIKVDLEANARTMEDREAIMEIQDWLIENVKFTLPPEIIDEKKEDIAERLRQEYQRHGEDLDLLLKRVDEKASSTRHEIDRIAEEQARLDFVINDIASREDIKVDQSDMTNHIQLIAQQSKLKKHQIKKLMEDENFLISVFNSILKRKVSNFLLNHSIKEYLTEEELQAEKEKKPDKDNGGESNLIIPGT